jgi:putative hydrolase of the HAD superfamily
VAEHPQPSAEEAAARVFEALLLDIGDVISAPVWEQLDELERYVGRPIVGRGPLDPAGDEPWQRFQQGTISYYDYWRELAERNGYEDWRTLFRELAVHLPHRFGDPDAYALMADARAAGLKVGVLTNDGVGIAGHDFFASVPEFQSLDAFVDARELGSAKPEPEPYLRAAKALGTVPERVVFLDDTQVCIDGAERVGMTAVLVDPVDKRPAFEHTRQLLGLTRSRSGLARPDGRHHPALAPVVRVVQQR